MGSQKNKQRILRILKYLYSFTDEQHPVTNQDLVAMFADEVTSGNRKTIKNDIEVLTEAGFDVITSKQYRNSYYMASRIFEVPEVKMLIDSVAASRFITKEKSDSLIGKLSKLVSKPQAETLVRHMYTANVLKPNNEQIYYAIDVITDAINAGRQIRFQYYDYLPTKEKILKNNGENYYLSPIAMVWDDNHYYVIGHSEKHPEPFIINFRIDRICHAEITEEPSILPEDGFSVEEYVNRQFRMNVGEAVEVILECKNERMRSVIDHFGEDVETWIADDEHFRVRVHVADSPTFYSWIFGFVGDIRIVGPEAVANKYQDMLMMGLQKETFAEYYYQMNQQLLEDINVAEDNPDENPFHIVGDNPLKQIKEVKDETKNADKSVFNQNDVKKAIRLLEQRKASIARYYDLLQSSTAVNIAEDLSFQKAFTAFYRLRRDKDWRAYYFDLFECMKSRKEDVSFGEIQLRLFLKCGQIESSFSSKMLATINPDMPIWDSYVLKNLGLKLRGKNKEERFSMAVVLYDNICSWYRDFLKTDEAKEMIGMFDQAFPEYSNLTEIKKIDFIIWALR